jgi:hypothetical protein
LKTKIYFILLCYFLYSCNNEQLKSQKTVASIQNSLDKTFINSVWVNQPIGENGEMPDTIVFQKNNYLIYIGHEPNSKDLCSYILNKDTLTFISQGTINDPKDFDKEILCEYSIKALLKGDFLTYISVDMKNPADRSSKHFDYRDNNLKFKRIKKEVL